MPSQFGVFHSTNGINNVPILWNNRKQIAETAAATFKHVTDAVAGPIKQGFESFVEGGKDVAQAVILASGPTLQAASNLLSVGADAAADVLFKGGSLRDALAEVGPAIGAVGIAGALCLEGYVGRCESHTGRSPGMW